MSATPASGGSDAHVAGYTTLLGATGALALATALFVAWQGVRTPRDA